MDVENHSPYRFDIQKYADTIAKLAPRLKPWFIWWRPILPGLTFCGFSSDGAGGICLSPSVLESEMGQEILSEVQRRAPGRVRVGFVGE